MQGDYEIKPDFKIEDGKVIVTFDRQTTFIKMTPSQARNLAIILKRMAKAARVMHMPTGRK